MIVEKVDKTSVEHLIQLIKTAQKSIIHIRQYNDQNNTIDFSTVGSVDDAEQPDPLRLPEILIVICVLLLWCASIFIFIRHSELLRIRHRDLPFRSTIKPAINLNHISVVNRTSDMMIHSKSGVSSASGLTPPPIIHHNRHPIYQHGDALETISLTISPLAKKRRHTHSYEFNRSSSIKYSLDKHNDKECLLHPYRIPSDKEQNLLNSHRKSFDTLHRKSMENLSTIKYTTFYSTNDILTRKDSNDRQLINQKRCIQESPV